MLNKLRLRLRALFFKSKMEEELDEEVRFHLECVVNFSALFAAICLRPLTLPVVIGLMYGTKSLSN
jgi:hypothetical protein